MTLKNLSLAKMLCLWPLLAALATVFTTAAAQEGDPAYTLNPGDQIQVYVLGEPDLTVQLTIASDGMIFFPLLGKVPVAGLTEAQVASTLTDLLSGDYLVNPRVTVDLLSFRKYFIQGAVANPGGQTYRPGLTVGRAIVEAGGLTERASSSRIYIIREADPAGEEKKASMETELEPGDIITVKESFF